MKKDSIAYVVLFTFIACVVFVLPLAVANEVTRPLVEANKLFALRSSVLDAFNIGYQTPEDAEAEYSASIRETAELNGSPIAWAATIDGAEYRAVRRSGPGLWGTITVIVAADPLGERVRGLQIVDQIETPGLGGRIGEPWFIEQFREKKVGEQGLRADQSGSGEGELDKESPRVDAIAGASRTSDFFVAIVNGAIADIKAGGGAP